MDIDKIFKDRLYNLEQNPDSNLWEKLSSQIPENKPKKKSVMWWVWPAGIAAALAVLLVFVQTPEPAYKGSGLANKISNSKEKQSVGVEKNIVVADDTQINASIKVLKNQTKIISNKQLLKKYAAKQKINKPLKATNSEVWVASETTRLQPIEHKSLLKYSRKNLISKTINLQDSQALANGKQIIIIDSNENEAGPKLALSDSIGTSEMLALAAKTTLEQPTEWQIDYIVEQQTTPEPKPKNKIRRWSMKLNKFKNQQQKQIIDVINQNPVLAFIMRP